MNEQNGVCAEIEDEIEVLESTPTEPFEKLIIDPYKAALMVSADLDHFTNLTLPHKKRLYNAIKVIKPYPEFKEDHKWICGFMKEEIDYLESEGAEETVQPGSEGDTLKAFLGEGSCLPEDCGFIVDVCRDYIAKIKALPNINNYQRGRMKGYKEILEFMGI
jgi:hypothetical protein